MGLAFAKLPLKVGGRKNADLLKCKVQWSRVARIHLHGVRVFSLGACGDGDRLSRAVPAIRLTKNFI